MPRAFVLINADIGYEFTLAADMKDISGIREAYTLYGTYDILVKVDAHSMDELKEFIGTRIRKVKGVKSTLTMLIMKKDD
ncbi:MAG TPA: Lrp/AsnC ligand binding domain-containing protein [Nitrososphaeraceae archaeon]|jgi:DNA-binding Lrp family transcriptional regulator|nr:Lrp/AsnC ligand binding domain-containing protein [Nitrososphaeraceae archaeon]